MNGTKIKHILAEEKRKSLKEKEIILEISEISSKIPTKNIIGLEKLKNL